MAGNLEADVEGDLVERDGVIVIGAIRLNYRLKVPPGGRERVERVLERYARGCPAYQSVKSCIDVSWQAEVTEE